MSSVCGVQASGAQAVLFAPVVVWGARDWLGGVDRKPWCKGLALILGQMQPLNSDEMLHVPGWAVSRLSESRWCSFALLLCRRYLGLVLEACSVCMLSFQPWHLAICSGWSWAWSSVGWVDFTGKWGLGGGHPALELQAPGHHRFLVAIVQSTVSLHTWSTRFDNICMFVTDALWQMSSVLIDRWFYFFLYEPRESLTLYRFAQVMLTPPFPSDFSVSAALSTSCFHLVMMVEKMAASGRAAGEDG